MSESDFSPEYSSNQATLYSRGAPNSTDEQRFEYYFSDSRVAAWTEERIERYQEWVKPHAMYIDDYGHTVAWISHMGLSEDDNGSHNNYRICHVVCDCAAESEELSGHPQAVRSCEVVDAVLEQRAREIGKVYGNDVILGALTEVDEEAMDFKLTYEGQVLAAKAIAYVLETDKIQPETWMANPINGLHKVNTLASILNQGTQAVMPLLEAMEAGELLTINGDEVRLSPDIPFF